MQEASRVFCEVILEMGRKEKKLEVIRQVLCEIADFEPYSAFRRLDRNHKNYLDQSDIFLFLSENNLDFPENFIRDSILQHYDLDLDGKLLYAEFLRCLLPADHPTLRTIVSQRPIFEKDIQKLPEEVEYTLSKLLSEEINVFIETEHKKKDLHSLLAGDYDSLFLDIDESCSGYIDFNNLMDYLQKNGIYPYEEEVIYILRRLDQDDDGRISLLELQKELSPKNSSNLLSTNQKNAFFAENFNEQKDRFKSSASKLYPYEPIRRSASPMKAQIMKSPIKSNYQQPILNESQTKIRNYKETITYESPKKKLDFEANYTYNSPYKDKNVADNDYKSLKAEIEKELSYSKVVRTSPYKSNVKDFMENPISNNYNNKYTPNASSANANLHHNIDYRSSAINNEAYSSQKKGTVVNDLLLTDIAQYLKMIIRCEREIIYIRQDLSLRPDFNPEKFFNCFDKLMKGYLNPEEINEFFECFEVFMAGEKNIFLQRFCKTKEILNFCDFMNVFYGNKEYMEGGNKNISNTSQRLSIKKTPKELFSVETFNIMKDLIRSIISNEKKLEKMCNELFSKNVIDFKDVFSAIDVNKNGVLSEFEIKRFLEKFDIYFQEKDIANLLEKADKSKKKSLSLTEFARLFYN